jgi:cysteinyl-tRNA synthetase
MALHLHNTLTKKREAFQPLAAGQVKMYCCGVTVYDYCHLGHARSYIAWDTVRRYLVWSGYQVTYVQNFTDIDDKILKRARVEGTTMDAVSEKYIAAYFEDMDRLNIQRADEYPRATHTIDGIKRLIHELEQKGFAYAVAGDVYYAVRQKADYGKLSGRDLDDLESGASGRVNDDEVSKKRDPFDFALWKAAKMDEPFWPSDWGNGRPGWHIECSAMVRDRFGDQIDIHVGGGDLIFPHHENEIAQSEAATGKLFSKYWMHNGMVNVEGTKMSKSLGNFTTVRDLLDRAKIAPMAMRLFVLGANYRKPIDFTEAAMTAATNGWQTMREGLLLGLEYGAQLGWDVSTQWARVQLDQGAIAAFNQAMDDDFNTSGAMAVLFELAKKLQRERNLLVHQSATQTNPQLLEQQWQTLTVLAAVLGLETTVDAAAAIDGLTDAAIDDWVAQRLAAKAAKDFATADRIRDELKAQGIVLIDQPGGKVIWHR